MTFSCDRVALHAALVLVNKLAGPSVASALLVASEDGALTVAAGSPERGARVSLSASRVLLPGECVVPLRPLLDLLGSARALKAEVAADAKSHPRCKVEWDEGTIDPAKK